jgi:hypothetical protein
MQREADKAQWHYVERPFFPFRIHSSISCKAEQEGYYELQAAEWMAPLSRRTTIKMHTSTSYGADEKTPETPRST